MGYLIDGTGWAFILKRATDRGGFLRLQPSWLKVLLSNLWIRILLKNIST